VNITSFSKKFIQELTQRQTDREKKENLEWLFSPEGKDALKIYLDSHEVWDLLMKHHEVVFDPQEFSDLMMPLLPRFYSIASSMREVGEEIHLTVALLQYETNDHSRVGVTTNYLCNLVPVGEPCVPIYLHPNTHGFTVPENPATPLIMIGPGTGIAPYRGFMQERIHQIGSGPHWLFFGEWNRAYDYLYEEDWMSWEAAGKLRIDLAFSRDQAHKVYVQHKLLEQGKELYAWLQQGANVYVCGDAHSMAKDVDQTLHQIVRTHGQMTDDQSKQYLKQLRADHRYMRDVY
jgi:sulfite reductase (NADPH) flavoprotein alpha-component